MKILLVGEYSRLHNSLKEGLTQLGHDVVIVASGDSFKKYATDHSIASHFLESAWLLKKAAGALFKVTGANLFLTEKGLRFYNLLPKLKGFDHIQLINSDAMETHPWLAKRLYKKLLAQNNSNLSLLICGDETRIIDYYLTGKLKYSVLTPYLKDNSLRFNYRYSLKYATPGYRNLFNWIQANAKCLITSDLDYEVPMKAMGYETTFIPNPVNSAVISFIPPLTANKVIIFLGINRMSYIKKGIVFFEEALKVIAKKYPDNVEIIVTENIPYAEYITLYNSAHIVLDQVYAYDQGYNALEAMAKGKVVFTGAEAEFTAHYSLTQKVAINALPDVDALVADLSFLIENPQEIVAIGTRARAFIENEHNYIEIAKRYLEAWGK